MNTLIFTLKQHTPLIHFQSEQQGATLRASEVKPRLDRFIFERLGNGSYKQGVKIALERNWRIKKAEHPSLDYKMRFSQPYFFSTKRSIINSEKDLILFIENIECTIQCFHSSLIDEIELVKSDFFLLKNFGFRTSKGYGSFTVDERLINYKEKIKSINLKGFSKELQIRTNPWTPFFKKCVGLPQAYKHNREISKSFDLKKEEIGRMSKTFLENFPQVDFSKLRFDKENIKLVRDYFDSTKVEIIKKLVVLGKGFTDDFSEKHDYFINNELPFLYFDEIHKTIDRDWRLLKSGNNKPYAKSLLFKYMCSKGYRWEKRLIKQRIVELKENHNHDINSDLKGDLNKMVDCLSNEDICADNKDSNFGFKDFPSQKEEFAFVRGLLGLCDNYEFQIKDQTNLVYKVSVESNNGIQRYQAPVMFKVVDNVVFAIPQQTGLPLGTNPTFNFSVHLKNSKNGWQSESYSLQENLQLPSRFDLNEFLLKYIVCPDLGYSKINNP
jgi:hypothetical protein